MCVRFSIRVQIPGGSSPSQRKSDELSECLFATCVMMKKSYQVINLFDWSVTVEEKNCRLFCLWSLEVTLLLHKSKFAGFLRDLTRFFGKLPMNAAMTSTILRYFEQCRLM